jgi:hypothetical protein
MRTVKRTTFAVLPLLAASGGVVDDPASGFGSDPITGGVTDSSRPAVCGLVNPVTNQVFCSGTLISVDPPRVVTAAHCLENTAPSEVAVGFGPTETSWDAVIAVEHVALHPDYDPTFRTQRPADIAYVDLVAAPPGVAPIAANSASLAGREGEWWLFVGYGVDSKQWLAKEGKGRYRWTGAGIKRSVSIPVETISAPRGEFDYYAYDSGQTEAANTCYGDSGGPALAFDAAGTEVVVGVTSRGSADCGALGALGIDTRVDTFFSFVSSSPPPPPVCGDGVCDGSEDCASCEADCGACPEAGGQCASCSSDADCDADGRCFQLSSESAPACHLSCSTTADCPSGYSCARITGGYGKRCVACP